MSLTWFIKPTNIAIDGNYLYVSNGGVNGYITKTDLTTLNTTTFVTGLFNPCGIVIFNNNVYVCNSGTSSIIMIDLNTGTKTTWVTGLYVPRGIAIYNNNAYVCNTGTIPSIIMIDLNTGTKTIWVTGFRSPYDIAIYNNNAYVCDTGTSSIIMIDLNTGTQTTWVTGLNYPRGITIYNNTAYVTNYGNNNNTSSFITIDLNTKNINTIYIGSNGLYGIVLDNTYTYAYICDYYAYTVNIYLINSPIGCFLADSKVLTDKGAVPIQLLKKGVPVQTLNHGLLPVKFVGKRSFFNKLTEERINPHIYKLNKIDFPELSEDLFITGGHPLLIDDPDEETKKKLLDIVNTPIITDGKYRVFACVHPKAELWNDEKKHEIFDIVLENEDPKKNYGIWVNGILTESMDEEYFLNHSGMTEINN